MSELRPEPNMGHVGWSPDYKTGNEGIPADLLKGKILELPEKAIYSPFEVAELKAAIGIQRRKIEEQAAQIRGLQSKLDACVTAGFNVENPHEHGRLISKDRDAYLAQIRGLLEALDPMIVHIETVSKHSPNHPIFNSWLPSAKIAVSSLPSDLLKRYQIEREVVGAAKAFFGTFQGVVPSPEINHLHEAVSALNELEHGR